MEIETEISVNGKILILLTETKHKKLRKTKMEKFEKESDKFGYICFISIVCAYTSVLVSNLSN